MFFSDTKNLMVNIVEEELRLGHLLKTQELVDLLK